MRQFSSLFTNKAFTVLVVTDTYDAVMLCTYDSKGKISVIATGRSDFGIAMGDIIDYDFNTIDNCINKLKESIKAKEEVNTVFNMIYDCMCSTCSHTTDILLKDYYLNNNIYVLSLFAELFNNAIEYRDGKKVQFNNTIKIIDYYKEQIIKLNNLCNTVLSPDNEEDPLLTIYKENCYLPSPDYTGKTILFNSPFENEDHIVDAFLPNTIEDFIGYCVNKTLNNKRRFIRCHYCNRFFAFTTNSKPKYCSRPIVARSKTCNEIGRSLRYVEDINSNDAKKVYSKYYKKVHYHLKAGNISKKLFDTWATEARTYRDKTERGEMNLEQYEIWLKESTTKIVKNSK